MVISWPAYQYILIYNPYSLKCLIPTHEKPANELLRKDDRVEAASPWYSEWEVSGWQRIDPIPKEKPVKGHQKSQRQWLHNRNWEK